MDYEQWVYALGGVRLGRETVRVPRSKNLFWMGGVPKTLYEKGTRITYAVKRGGRGRWSVERGRSQRTSLKWRRVSPAKKKCEGEKVVWTRPWKKFQEDLKQALKGRKALGMVTSGEVGCGVKDWHKGRGGERAWLVILVGLEGWNYT